jgi:beta-glucosidase
MTDNTQTQATETELPTSFPADFLWGTATSAYQIEGATHEDGRGLSIWDTFAATPGNTHAGETGDVADDHYHRMAQDVALMGELGVNAYRFSIAWPRVLPTGTGQVNDRGLDFYSRLVDALLAHNIAPVATLFHWDLPVPLQDRGGWLNRDTAMAFADYAEVVARRLGDRVAWWITHNEPWCTAYLGHAVGRHAPGMRDRRAAVVAAHHVLLSHGLAVPRLRAHAQSGAPVGITLNLRPAYAADDRPETLRAVAQADALHNRWFLDPVFRASYPEDLFTDLGAPPPPIEADDLTTIAIPLDFLGVNYYTRGLVRAREGGSSGAATTTPGAYEEITSVPGATYTEMGWEVYPAGLTDLIMRINRDYAPRTILVTENGAAFDDRWDGDEPVKDPQRVAYLRAHVQAVATALAQGVPLRGYFVWSFMDNYEWAEGYSKRFGIVYVDYPTQRRIVKESARWYAALIAAQRQRRE